MADSAKMGVNRRNLERSVRPCMAEGRAAAAWDAIQRNLPAGNRRRAQPALHRRRLCGQTKPRLCPRATGCPFFRRDAISCVSFARDRDDSLDDGTGPAIRPNKANRSRRVHSSRV